MINVLHIIQFLPKKKTDNNIAASNTITGSPRRDEEIHLCRGVSSLDATVGIVTARTLTVARTPPRKLPLRAWVPY